MVAAIETWAQTVFAQYDMQVVSITVDPARERRWILDTNHGQKVLDLYQDVQALWRDFDVAEYSAQHGYRRMPRMIRTLYGDPYVQIHDGWVALKDKIEGRALRFSPEDVLPAVRNLAAIHEALRGFEYADDGANTHSVRTWFEIMQSSIRDMGEALHVWQQASTRDHLQNKYLEQQAWLQKHIRNATVAFAGENISVDPLDRCLGGAPLEQQWIGRNDKVFFKEIPNPYLDTPIFDVARVCLLAAEQGHPDAIQDMLHEYQNVREIPDADISRIVTYVSFPHGLWKLFYLYRRKRATSEQLSELFNQTLERQMRREKQFEPYRSKLLQAKF